MMTRLVAAAILILVSSSAQADEFSAVEHQRQTVYHSPQKPGFTSWVGAWIMPDGSVMTSFTQATGPLKDRRAAPKDVQEKLNWPPKGSPGYDMTGLELKNVHLRSTDQGHTWKPASADTFQSCMNGVTGEAEAALADGTILRGVFGFYLPYDDVPRTGYLQRSADGTKTWGKPEVLLDPKKYTAWPRRIRVLRDGRIIVLMGVAPFAAGSHTRDELTKKLQPMLVVSSDGGKSWQGPIAAVPKEKPDGWTEEFDVAELENGDLLAVFRRANDTKRWQGVLKKSDKSWDAGTVGVTTLPHSGQPELLATKEGPILHLATTGIHWTTDSGKTWTALKIPGTAYYPRSVQSKDGRIVVLGHIGGDDPYGAVDQSIVIDSFRLETFVDATKKWQAEREKKLRAENGWLSLAGRFPLKEGDNTIGTGTDNDVVFPVSLKDVGPVRLGTIHVDDKAKTVTLKLPKGVTMFSEGKPFEGERVLGTATDKRDWASLGRLSFHIIERSGKFILRLADNESAVRKDFPGCVWYEPDAAFKVEAKYVPYEVERSLSIVNVVDEVSKQPCPGYIEFRLKDAVHRIDAIQEGKGLFLIFRDETAGDTTYRSGRFLDLEEMPKPNATFTLDFNKAYNPPCAFSQFTTCPLPPKQNVLKVRIEGGEKYRDKK